MLSVFVSINAFSITRVSMPVEVDAAGMYRAFFPPRPKPPSRHYLQFPVYMTANTNSVYWGKKSRFDQSRRASWYRLIFSVGAQDVAG